MKAIFYLYLRPLFTTLNFMKKLDCISTSDKSIEIRSNIHAISFIRRINQLKLLSA